MTDIPIIFSAPMICALLDGRKTMTRRLAWTVKTKNPNVAAIGREMGPDNKFRRPSVWQRVKPGDRLWVRENLAVMGNWGVWHDASDAPIAGQFLDDLDDRGRALLEKYAPADATESVRIPCIHMPRWASRLTLIVTATKIERLQDISDADREAEGIDYPSVPASDVFADLWRSLHGDDSWGLNPEVVALTFTVHKQNIDALPKGVAA